MGDRAPPTPISPEVRAQVLALRATTPPTPWKEIMRRLSINMNVNSFRMRFYRSTSLSLSEFAALVHAPLAREIASAKAERATAPIYRTPKELMPK